VEEGLDYSFKRDRAGVFIMSERLVINRRALNIQRILVNRDVDGVLRRKQAGMNDDLEQTAGLPYDLADLKQLGGRRLEQYVEKHAP